MSRTRPSPERIKAAADDVVEFALLSLVPEFHLWEKTVNLHVAELVWNAHACRAPFPITDPPEPALTRLIERLASARQTRWGEQPFLVLGLDVRHEDGEIFFTFDLTWDDGESFHACEIAVDFEVAGPTALN